MKVLHLLASNKYSGAENVVCTIIDNFKNEIEMVYCSPFGDIEKTLKNRNITYYGLDKMNKKCLQKVIDNFKPDIIHAHDYRASVLAATSGFKGKIISHLHNNCPFAKTWNLKTILYNFTISKYSKIIGVSDMVYEEAIFKKNMTDKFQTIYNYVDKKSIISKSMNYEYQENYDLFFIGRLTEQKDPLKFIEIIHELHSQNHKVTATMIGDGELRNECQNLIDSYKLNDYIKMLGFVENPFPIIKKCKIGIMPSKWEGFGLTAIESLILEKVVLNSGVGGLKEIFKNYPEFICNDQEYKEKIKLLLDEKKYNSFVKNTQEISKSFTNLKLYKDSLKKIY